MRKFALQVGSVLFLTSVSFAKITVDSDSQSAFVSATSVTWTHILGSCQPNELLVCCGQDAAAFTSVTFAGIPMTSLVTLTNTEAVAIYGLYNSTTTGSGSIVATWNSAVDGWCAARSFCGVNSTPKDSSNTGQQTSASPSIADTIVSSGSWIMDCMFNNGTALTAPVGTGSGLINLETGSGPSTVLSQTYGPFIKGAWTSNRTGATSAAYTQVIMGIAPSTGTMILTTQAPTSLTATSATGNGTLLNPGGYSINTSSDVGCAVGTAYNPTTANSIFNASGQAAFTCTVTGLTPNTNYHIRAYGINSQGTDYGNDVPFGTPTAAGNQVQVAPGKGTIQQAPGTGSVLVH